MFSHFCVGWERRCATGFVLFTALSVYIEKSLLHDRGLLNKGRSLSVVQCILNAVRIFNRETIPQAEYLGNALNLTIDQGQSKPAPYRGKRSGEDQGNHFELIAFLHATFTNDD